MNEIFTSVVSSITLSGLVSAAIVFLARNVISERIKNAIKNEYDQKLETHKNELKTESEKAVAQYNYVYKETLEALSGTYSRLADLKELVRIHIEFMGDLGHERSKKGKAAEAAIHDFDNFLRPRRIFLPPELLKKTEALRSTMWNLSLNFALFVENPDPNGPPRLGHLEEWKEINNVLSKEVPPIMEDLETEFRKLMGFHKGEQEK